MPDDRQNRKIRPACGNRQQLKVGKVARCRVDCPRRARHNKRVRARYHDFAYPLCALFAATACGGETDGASSSSAGSAGLAGSDGSGGIAGSGDSAGAGGSPAAECPSAPPTDGSACTAPWTIDGATSIVTAHCTWGDDPRPQCRTRAVCGDDGRWSVTAPDTATCSTSPLSAACPASPATPSATCSDTAIDCWYEDGNHCWCSGCFGGSPYPLCQTIDPPLWACRTLGEGCPAMTPQAGSSCNTRGAECSPDCNLRVACLDGVWQWHRSRCPTCAAPDTPVAAPGGERPIATLRTGDLVYSVDNDAIVVVPILRVASTPVEGHRVMRIELEGGALLEMSPGHPTADGRKFGTLVEGSAVDEQHRVVAAGLVPYEHDRTYDILPGSSTGSYFAAGARVGSTLHREQRQAP